MVTYSYTLFIVVLCCLSALIALSLESVRSFHRRPVLYLFWFMVSALFLIGFPLSLIAPWPQTALVLKVLMRLSIAPALISGALVLRLSVRRQPEDLLIRHEGALLDAVREGVVIFDADGRVLSFGRDNPLPGILAFDRRPRLAPDHPCAFLSGLLAAPREDSGTLRLDDKSFFWRFKPLPGGRGSLLTLLDTSDEQALADSLSRAGAALASRQRLLLSIENLDSEAAAARIREHISTEIDREVRVKLHQFLSYTTQGLSLQECLSLAEASLAEVRNLVNELAPHPEVP